LEYKDVICVIGSITIIYGIKEPQQLVVKMIKRYTLSVRWHTRDADAGGTRTPVGALVEMGADVGMKGWDGRTAGDIHRDEEAARRLRGVSGDEMEV
jgi:hypothetical protein